MKQYFCGTQYRYVGRHFRGRFTDSPALKKLDEVRDMCGLEATAGDLWLKALERVLDELVSFARHYDVEKTGDPPTCNFAIISDPNNDALSIHEYAVGATGGAKVDAVGEKTLKYLRSTIE